jgi:hypothetical protein
MEDKEHYLESEADVDNMWKFDMYAIVMMNLHIMIQKANALSSPYYTGVGQVLMAYSLGTMTDLFGDIPYSEAFQGSANLTPKFDKQQDIYADIKSLLDSAVINLSASSSVYSPSTNDLIFGGDNGKWIATAYSLKARYAIHLSKINGNSAYTDALVAISAGAISDASDSSDCEFQFGQASINNSPQYLFDVGRPGYLVMGALIIDSLNSTVDPRGPIYADTAVGGILVGSKPGELNGSASPIGALFKAPDAKVSLVNFVETKFIEAEANFQLGNLAAAASAYNAAVIGSLTKYGVRNAAWENTYANETAGTITLSKIMFQKYLGLYLQLEVYNDWRRTGIPGLLPSAGNVTNNVIPRRYPYPASERLENPKNCPAGVKITDRVWWDKAK